MARFFRISTCISNVSLQNHFRVYLNIFSLL